MCIIYKKAANHNIMLRQPVYNPELKRDFKEKYPHKRGDK